MTTPAQPESKTPRTEAAGVYWNSLPKLATSAQITYADFARQLETELNAARVQAEADRREIERWKDASGFCEKHQPTGGARNCVICGLEHLYFALAEIASICEGGPEVTAYDCHCDERAVVKQVEVLHAQLATAQQRIKELEQDGRRLDWLEKTGNGPAKNSAGLFLQCVHTITDNGQNVSIFTHKTARGVIDAAMSREPKEGEAK